MKTIALVAFAGIAAALFSVAAHAQTGRPSTQETAAAAATPRLVERDDALGSYARYLMLNGTPRAQAIAAARNIDHPASRAPVRALAATAPTTVVAPQ